jgi:Ca2+-binding EF-hand superfamily protein
MGSRLLIPPVGSEVMKPVKMLTLVLSLSIPVIAFGQPPEGDRPAEGRPERRPGSFGGREEGREGFRFPNPLLEALDLDKDGDLSTDEVDVATKSLKSLDKNLDGKLDNAEMRPDFGPMGPGGPGFGGPGGPGFGGGPGAVGGNPQEMIDRLMAMDGNDDGKLAKDELPERLQSMFSRADRNSDNLLDKEEMQAMARERSGGFGGSPGGPGGQGRGGDFMAQMMERSDANKDGELSEDEVPPFMKDRFSQLDSNSDGAIDKSELEAASERMRRGFGGGPPNGDGQRGRPGQRGQRPPVEGESEKDEQKKGE